MMLPSRIDGDTRTFVSESAASLLPITPIAGRAVGPAEIVQVYAAPSTAVLESQVQSTLVPRSDQVAATAPFASTTVTVHGTDELSLAVKRIGPPSAPDTTGV